MIDFMMIIFMIIGFLAIAFLTAGLILLLLFALKWTQAKLLILMRTQSSNADITFIASWIVPLLFLFLIFNHISVNINTNSNTHADTATTSETYEAKIGKKPRSK